MTSNLEGKGLVMFLAGLALGLFLGVVVGIFVAGLCVMAARGTKTPQGEETATANYAA